MIPCVSSQALGARCEAPSICALCYPRPARTFILLRVHDHTHRVVYASGCAVLVAEVLEPGYVQRRRQQYPQPVRDRAQVDKRVAFKIPNDRRVYCLKPLQRIISMTRCASSFTGVCKTSFSVTIQEHVTGGDSAQMVLAAIDDFKSALIGLMPW